mmetsp:Transcript_15309/g.36136  ORF Transcript_15309/g.36136 Transcript_15309/m.36136 type:complete len:429 (+) Transcript_15309:3-1289(+)
MRNMLCLDAGSVGRGRPETVLDVPDDAPVDVGADEPEAEKQYSPFTSGSAVFDGGKRGPACIKMIVTLPPYKSLEEFAEEHGWEGVKMYLRAAARGRDLEVSLARQVLPDPKRQVKVLGSVMVAPEEDLAALRNEFQLLQEVGCECSWLTVEQVNEMHGKAAGFAGGIMFPHDAIIDSTTFARSLLRKAVATGAVKLREGTTVEEVAALPDGSAQLRLADGSVIKAKRVVICTGGALLPVSDIGSAFGTRGLLRPCWSYLSALPSAPADSPNFFTFGFSHDWSFSDGFCRISGQDHYSALKRPRWQERCEKLAEWGWEKYPFLPRVDDYPQRYGVYTETPDTLPLVGSLSDDSPIFYIVGCNAWGQASLSAAAALMPGLLGSRKFSAEELETLNLFSIRRFTTKYANTQPQAQWGAKEARKPWMLAKL